MAAPPRRPARELPWIVFAVLFLVVPGVTFVLVVPRGYSDPPDPHSWVSEVNWSFSTCWSPRSSAGPGAVDSGTPFRAFVTLPSPASGSCTIQNLTTQPSVFLLAATNAPLTVGGGTSATLEITMNYEPSPAGFDGPVDVAVNVTTGA